jgi:hypothetical protein
MRVRSHGYSLLCFPALFADFINTTNDKPVSHDGMPALSTAFLSQKSFTSQLGLVGAGLVDINAAMGYLTDL